MAFARGKYAKAISDRSGMEFPHNEMMKEWNGMLVHKSEYEAKHPQLETRGTGAEGHGLQHVRPARTEEDVVGMLGPNPFSTIAAASGIINVFEKSHGRDTDDTVRFRGPIWTSSDSAAYQNPNDFDGISGSNISYSSGYSITVGKRDSSGDITNTDDYYHFTVNTNTATSGGVSGGGNNCSAGPTSLSA
jgi:hypothetical protein